MDLFIPLKEKYLPIAKIKTYYMGIYEIAFRLPEKNKSIECEKVWLFDNIISMKSCKWITFQ